MNANPPQQSNVSTTDSPSTSVTSPKRRRLLKQVGGVGALGIAGITAATGSVAAASWPTHSSGDTGNNIVVIQFLLYEHGHALSDYDGIFGPETASAVRSFQSSRGLTVDGIVGPQTWQALVITVSHGDDNFAVASVQGLLISEHGYDIGYDGVFGPETASAVRSFQSSRGLTVDGIVGPQTWQALVST